MRNGSRFFPVSVYYVQPYLYENNNSLLTEYTNSYFNTHNLEWANANQYINHAILQGAVNLNPWLGLQNSTEIQSIPYNPNNKTSTLTSWVNTAKTIVETVASSNANDDIFAWYTWDEPCDGFWYEVTKGLHEAIREKDPYHPSLFVSNDPPSYSVFSDATDIFGIDPYPYMPWKPLKWVADCTDAAVFATKGTGKPIMVVIQSFYEKSQSNGYMPTPTELRNMTYSAIVHGATAISYFSFDYDGERLDNDYPTTWSTVKSLSQEIETIENALVSDLPDSSVLSITNANTIDVELFRETNNYYIIAVNSDNSSCSGVNFNLTDTSSVYTDVMFENRTLNVSNGSWTDNFTPYAVHIYKISR